MDEILEQRICIRACVKNDFTVKETLEFLQKAYPEVSLKRTSVFEWVKRFKNGENSIQDVTRPGRPVEKRTGTNIEKIKGLIIENPKIRIEDLSASTGISVGSVHSIIHDDLDMEKKFGKFIPKHLTQDQKQTRLEICKEMIEMVAADEGWFKKVITGDEMWVYGYDPETRRQSREWRRRNEPKPKKARFSKSKLKVLLVTFFDYKGLIHREFIPEGQTINQHVYLSILRRLREAVRKKRPDKWVARNWILHHDNARPHTAVSVMRFLAKNKLQLLHQAPYSPDLAPNDFFLYCRMKMALKGHRFESREMIIQKSLQFFRGLKESDYTSCFNNWCKRWHRCLDAGGDYFEEY